MVVYDVTTRESFDSAQTRWLKSHQHAREDQIRILVGNNMDGGGGAVIEVPVSHHKAAGRTHGVAMPSFDLISLN